MKPIKSNFDMTPQEKNGLFVQAASISENHAKEILQQLISKGSVNPETSPVELTKLLVEMAKPIRDYLTQEPPKSKVIS